MHRLRRKRRLAGEPQRWLHRWQGASGTEDEETLDDTSERWVEEEDWSDDDATDRDGDIDEAEDEHKQPKSGGGVRISRKGKLADCEPDNHSRRKRVNTRSSCDKRAESNSGALNNQKRKLSEHQLSDDNRPKRVNTHNESNARVLKRQRKLFESQQYDDSRIKRVNTGRHDSGSSGTEG